MHKKIYGAFPSSGGGTTPKSIGPILGKFVTAYDSLTGFFTLGLVDYSYITNTPQLPNSFASVAHKFLTSYNAATGNFVAAQPDYSDLTGTPQLPITAGPTTHKFLSAYSSLTGNFTLAQPDYSDLTGTPQLPISAGAVAHKVLTAYSSVTGLFTLAQLAAADLSDGTTGTGAIVLANSPALLGTPTAPTPTTGDNSTKVATTAFVVGAIATTPWLNLVDPTTTVFTWMNQGGASETVRTKSLFLLAPANAGTSLRCRYIAASAAPFSVTIAIIPSIFNQSSAAGIFVSDGTKLTAMGVISGTAVTFNVIHYNSATSFASNVATPGLVNVPTPIFLKILDDGTNLKFFWSPNGLDFLQVYSEARLSWLASVSRFGYYTDAENASWAAGSLLVSFTTGNS